MKKFSVVILLLVVVLISVFLLATRISYQRVAIEETRIRITSLYLQIHDLQREIMLLKWRLAGINVVDATHIPLGNYLIINQGKAWIQDDSLRRLPEFDFLGPVIGTEPMIPLRPLVKMLDHQVTWNEEQKTAHVTNRWEKELYAAFTAGQQGVTLGENNRTYIPLNLVGRLSWEGRRIEFIFIDHSGTIFIKIAALG